MTTAEQRQSGEDSALRTRRVSFTWPHSAQQKDQQLFMELQTFSSIWNFSHASGTHRGDMEYGHR